MYSDPEIEEIQDFTTLTCTGACGATVDVEVSYIFYYDEYGFLFNVEFDFECPAGWDEDDIKQNISEQLNKMAQYHGK